MRVLYQAQKKKTKPTNKRKIKTATPWRRAVYKTIGQTRTSLAAFVARPRQTTFATQDEKEEIILLLRKHWITNLPWIAAACLMVVAPLVLWHFPILDFFPPRFQITAVFGWYLLTFAFVLERFLTWFFNVYIITDERIVDIDFYNLIYKEISDAELAKIQDVTLKMGGVIQTLFNYGTILIQTAAERPQFEFEAVPQPAKVVKVLEQLRMEEQQEELEGRVR